MKRDLLTKGSVINTEIGTIEIVSRNDGGLFHVIERFYDVGGEIVEKRDSWMTKDEIEIVLKFWDGKNHHVVWEG